jgi:hypothetical protein
MVEPCRRFVLASKQGPLLVLVDGGEEVSFRLVNQAFKEVTGTLSRLQIDGLLAVLHGLVETTPYEAGMAKTEMEPGFDGSISSAA